VTKNCKGGAEDRGFCQKENQTKSPNKRKDSQHSLTNATLNAGEGQGRVDDKKLKEK